MNKIFVKNTLIFLIGISFIICISYYIVNLGMTNIQEDGLSNYIRSGFIRWFVFSIFPALILSSKDILLDLLRFDFPLGLSIQEVTKQIINGNLLAVFIVIGSETIGEVWYDPDKTTPEIFLAQIDFIALVLGLLFYLPFAKELKKLDNEVYKYNILTRVKQSIIKQSKSKNIIFKLFNQFEYNSTIFIIEDIQGQLQYSFPFINFTIALFISISIIIAISLSSFFCKIYIQAHL
ncbi:MAG: hypothetical protein ACFBSE_07945 [Prochloraceae cyanobacterium]